MKRAKVDADGIYLGSEDVEVLADGDIAAPDECIKPGQYRWQPAVYVGEGEERRMADVGHWVPLPPHRHKNPGEAVTTERALYEFWKTLHQTGVPLPQHTLDWAVGWETSFDAMTARGVDEVSAGRGEFDYFRVALGILKARP